MNKVIIIIIINTREVVYRDADHVTKRNRGSGDENEQLEDPCHDKAHVWSWLTSIFIFQPIILSRAPRIHHRSAWSLMHFSKISLSAGFCLFVCKEYLFMLCDGLVRWEQAHTLYFLPNCTTYICSYIRSGPNDPNIFQRNILQPCGDQFSTFCARLATLLRFVVTTGCCLLKFYHFQA